MFMTPLIQIVTVLFSALMLSSVVFFCVVSITTYTYHMNIDRTIRVFMQSTKDRKIPNKNFDKGEDYERKTL